MADSIKKAEAKEPRILLYDIETSLQTVAVFQLGGNDWIQPSNILQERHMLTAAWQWLGEKEVHSVSLLDDPKRYAKDPHDDGYVVKTLHDVISEADCTIAHYGDSFDLKYQRTRALYHGLDPLPPIPSIDTKKVAKSHFYFNANNLDYLGKFLGIGRKVPHSPGLWLDILKGGPKAEKALKEMEKYNRGDVTLLRDVYLKLRPHIPNHLSRELFGNVGCPVCGSKKYQSRGTQHAITRSYRRFQCSAAGCRKWFRALKADKDSTTKYRVL